MRRYALFTALLMLGFVFVSCKSDKPAKEVLPPVDYYLVIDTSGSMADGTIDKVKSTLPVLLQSVHLGDKVSLIRFDSDAQSVAEFTIQSDTDIAAIANEVQSLKATGLHTDIGRLIEFLKEHTRSVSEIERRQYIVILSDGIDDPPPPASKAKKNTKQSKVSLSEYEAKDKLPVQEPFIYYVDVSNGQSKQDRNTSVNDHTDTNEANSANKNQLNENLQELSGEVNVIKPDLTDSNNDNLGFDSLQQDINAHRASEQDWQEKCKATWSAVVLWAKSVPWWVWLIVGLVVLLLLWLFWKWTRPGQPLEGVLSFYGEDEHPSLAKDVSLRKFRRNDVTIGSASGSMVRIKSREFPKQLRFKVSRKGQGFRLKTSKKDLQTIDFMIQKTKGYISSGDRFRIKQYIFEYNNGTKK